MPSQLNVRAIVLQKSLLWPWSMGGVTIKQVAITYQALFIHLCIQSQPWCNGATCRNQHDCCWCTVHTLVKNNIPVQIQFGNFVEYHFIPLSSLIFRQLSTVCFPIKSQNAHKMILNCKHPQHALLIVTQVKESHTGGKLTVTPSS